MFLKSTQPLERKCERALIEAQNGGIASSLALLSSIRWQRALMDETATAAKDPNSLMFLSDGEMADLNTLVGSIPRLHELLESLDRWTAQAYEESEPQELFDSDLGLNLYIEYLLPKAWFYSGDIAVLAGNYLEKLHHKMAKRGQRRFVIFLPSDQDAKTSLLEYLSRSATSEDLLVSPDMLPSVADIKTLVGDTWPKLGVLSTDLDGFERSMVETLLDLLSSVCIQATTQKWLPQLTTEQYLDNLPRVAELPSIMQCEDAFRGAQVVVVSPGPSLRQDLETLKAVHNQFIIVAALKAVDTLLDAGIVPDFAIWQDPRDHSIYLPANPRRNEVSLILSDSCHAKFFAGGFKTHFIYSDFNLSSLPMAAVIHGNDGLRVGASSVSTVACLLALGLGCRGITLIGQDLHVSNGHYVSDSVSITDETKDLLDASEGLTCKGIDGEQLETLPNYLSFIGEFEQIALAYPHESLVNCTSHGAFLAGWEHMGLSERLNQIETREKKHISIVNPTVIAERKSALVESCLSLQESLRLWLKSSGAAADLLMDAIELGSAQTALAMQEKKLRELLDGDCQVLKYYCAGVSRLVANSVPSCEEVEDTYRMSMDYYAAMDRAARKLISICDDVLLAFAESDRG